MSIRGTARVGEITKVLVKRLNPGDIAVIDHRELDDLAAHNLVEARVKAVINASPSISDSYPNGGPHTLVSAGIVLLDNVGKDIMKLVKDGQTIEISGDNVICGGKVTAAGKTLDITQINEKMDLLKDNMQSLIHDFINNTLDYARNEMELISGVCQIPEINTPIEGKHVLIVIRGRDYKNDLKAIRHYIDEIKPVLIGVDGGADALREIGCLPDIIIGDMDSVSDGTLRSGAELIAHAYRDGKSPGLERINKLGLKSILFRAPGTSEDIAMLLAHEKKAELIVLVGSHSSIIDFLDKGRKGMASTFLVRQKVGGKLVDAKGVSKLYKSRVKARQLAQIALAALIPAIMVMLLSPPVREIIRLIYLQFRFYLGI
jgi:uncharacterized membrane-anchored protein